ncbi:MAG: hypothetical protein AB1861_08325 [Cyanobacteriota bacterium]
MFKWADIEQTTLVDENNRSIPVTTDNEAYREEVLPWIAAGNVPAPVEVIEAPNYPGFRGAIALAPEYERILDAIAAISATRQSSIVRVWGEVKDLESLKLAAGFWNLRVVPDAQITTHETTVLQNLVDKFNIPIVVKSGGFIEVVL